jgi:hypothetical protein
VCAGFDDAVAGVRAELGFDGAPASREQDGDAVDGGGEADEAVLFFGAAELFAGVVKRARRPWRALASTSAALMQADDIDKCPTSDSS